MYLINLFIFRIIFYVTESSESLDIFIEDFFVASA